MGIIIKKKKNFFFALRARYVNCYVLFKLNINKMKERTAKNLTIKKKN